MPNNQPTVEVPLLLTYREAGRLLGLSDRTIFSIVDRGELPVVRLARRAVRIDRRDLELFIANSKSKAVQP